MRAQCPSTWTKAKIMEHSYIPFLDPQSRVARNIAVRAQKLANTGNLPGLDADDIRQELLLHLVKRQASYDPTRAGYDTFADRVLANRIADLAAPTSAIEGNRTWVDIEAPIQDKSGEGAVPLSETLGESAALFNAPHRSADEVICLAIDVRRLIACLPQPCQIVACAILQFDLNEIPHRLGLHRSTVHDRIRAIRKAALDLGLDDYLGGRPTVSTSRR